MPQTPESAAEFAAVFAELRSILAEYEPKLVVVHDTSDNYYLDTYTVAQNKKPIMFGAVRVMKNYVSYHLMSVYAKPELLNEMSPALKKHMQGKACFNFKTRDPELFDELKRLTREGYLAWKRLKWIQ